MTYFLLFHIVWKICINILLFFENKTKQNINKKKTIQQKTNTSEYTWGKAHYFLTGTNCSGDDYWPQSSGSRVCFSDEIMSFSQTMANFAPHKNQNLPYTTPGSASGSGSSPGISAGSGSIVGIDGMICTGSGGFSGNMPINYLEACMHYERPIPIVPPPPQMHSEDEIEPAYATGTQYTIQ